LIFGDEKAINPPKIYLLTGKIILNLLNLKIENLKAEKNQYHFSILKPKSMNVWGIYQLGTSLCRWKPLF